ncbi:hypothetical protein [Lacihabitans soyangensis]|jgi:hypothetical protein|uniref:Uncharacterized protein n=1 Tax=Lacihabitans soyangensis TaxID=869394 RepID=A0AAE3H2T5_9BACT|nr:hypothetical protein [Lacihabitans soyangensis]MCP9764044.1 hypothetical protein [Lacihabitans soyangensis]
METKTYFFDLHADHVEWLKALDFYADELLIFKNRLAEVSVKNTSSEIKKEVEKYQNKFIIQKNEIDNLKHYIHGSERDMEEEIKKNPVAIDHRKTTENLEIRDKMEMFAKLFADLKEEFNEFVGRNL